MTLHPRSTLFVLWGLLLAACARPRQLAQPQPGLFGPSAKPGLLPPRVPEAEAPRTDEQWRALGREAAALLSQYVAINTTNPPGNELQTAQWLKAVLARDGIEAQLFEPQPGKANLYARLKGDGSARPLILLNHMDVVLASPEYWRVDPFGGVTKDGYVWGRGAIRADANGRIEYYGVGTTEKSPFWLDVTARGTAGHGSRPTPDNPVHRLIRALNRIAEWRTPLTVTPAVERSFRDLATIERDSTVRRWLSDIQTALRDSVAVRAITADLTYNALLRNTISITGLKGSDKTNVIPPVATAAIDVRLLPGQDPAAFLAELTRVVGDSAVTIRPQGPNWLATESSTETEMFRAITAVAHM